MLPCNLYRVSSELYQIKIIKSILKPMYNMYTSDYIYVSLLSIFSNKVHVNMNSVHLHISFCM